MGKNETFSRIFRVLFDGSVECPSPSPPDSPRRYGIGGPHACARGAAFYTYRSCPTRTLCTGPSPRSASSLSATGTRSGSRARTAFSSGAETGCAGTGGSPLRRRLSSRRTCVHESQQTTAVKRGASRVARSLRIHHPPALVNVNPNLESRSTETRMPIMPSPCGDSTWPRTTDTRLNTNNNVHSEYGDIAEQTKPAIERRALATPYKYNSEYSPKPSVSLSGDRR